MKNAVFCVARAFISEENICSMFRVEVQAKQETGRWWKIRVRDSASVLFDLLYNPEDGGDMLPET
jgi:hypothetical protein